jgi:Domain of unknown function (DUF6968)
MPEPLPSHQERLRTAMTEIIAERLYRARGNIPVVARIYAPVRAPRGHKIARPSEWLCWVEIEGLETPFRNRVIGCDSFQALELGLHLLCSQLDEVGATLSFLNGREGNTMTPMIVCWPFGSEGKADIHRYVQAKFKEELKRRQRRKGPNRPV